MRKEIFRLIHILVFVEWVSATNLLISQDIYPIFNLNEDHFIMDIEHLDQFDPKFQSNVKSFRGIGNGLTMANAERLIRFFKRLKINRKSVEITITGDFEPMKFDLHRGFPITIIGPSGIKEDRIPNPRNQLFSRDLRVIWLRIFPYVYESDSIVIGCDVQALEELSKKHGFRYNLTQALYADVPSGKNSSDVGIIDGLQEGKFDVSISPLAYSLSRFQKVDFSGQIHSHVMGFLGTHPKPVDVFDTLFKPFGTHVWSCLLVVVIIYLATLIIFFQLKKYEAWMMTFGPLMAESLPRTTLKLTLPWTIRNLMCLWLMGSFMVGMAYKSNLLANLSIITYQKQIQTPEEIYKSGYPVFTIKRTILESILRDSPVELYQRIYNQNVKGNLLNGSFRSEEKDSLVPQGKAFEFHTWLQTFSMPDRKFLGQPVTQNAGAWNFPLNSFLNNILNRDLTKLKESGILDKWLHDLLERESKHSHNTEPRNSPTHRPLSLRLIYPLLISAGLGWTMAMVCFLFELFFKSN